MADPEDRPIISRTEALRLGLKRYFTGVSCLNGHTAERRLRKNRCTQCEKEKVLREGARKPERDKAYYFKNKEKIKARTRAWKRAHPSDPPVRKDYYTEAITAQVLGLTSLKPVETPKSLNIISRFDAESKGLIRYFTGHPCVNDHVAERRVNDNCCTQCRKLQGAFAYKRNKTKFDGRSWRWKKVINPKRHEDWRREYYIKNKARYLANGKARDMLERRAMPPWADRKEIANIYCERQRISEETGVVHHVDHIVPLKAKNVCGLHVAWNLQIITAAENQKKFNSFYDWENVRVVARRRST